MGWDRKCCCGGSTGSNQQLSTDGALELLLQSGGSATLRTETTEVDWSCEARYSLTGDANEPGNELAATSESEDAADSCFAISGNGVQYTPQNTPDFIEISGMAFVDLPQSGTLSRLAPELELLKNGTPLPVRSATGYQRHATDHTSSSNTLVWLDTDPQAGDVYTFRAQQGSSQDDVADIDLGHASFVASEKKQITYVVGWN